MRIWLCLAFVLLSHTVAEAQFGEGGRGSGGFSRPQAPANQPQGGFGQPQNPAAQPQNPAAQPQNPAAQPQNPAAQPQAPAQNQQRYLDAIQRGERERKAKVRQLRSMLRSRPTRWTFVFPDGAWASGTRFVKPELPNVKDQLKRISELPQGGFMPTMTSPIRVGSLGVVRNYLRVLQIVGESDCLVEICYNHDPLDRYHICKGKTVWFRGIPTTNLNQGEVTTGGEILLEVTGTHVYTTVLGAQRAVPVFEPFPIPQGVTPIARRR